MSPLGFFISADELGGIHPEGLRQLADRAPLGLRHVAEKGESYMGLFPRTVGKRFLRARTRASRGPTAATSARAREREEGRMSEQNHAEPCIFIRHHKM